MSNWFHRNPLKSTTDIKFDLPMNIANKNGVEICSNLKKLRLELLEHFQNLQSNSETVEKCFNLYLSFFLGLIDNESSDLNLAQFPGHFTNQSLDQFLPSQIPVQIPGQQPQQSHQAPKQPQQQINDIRKKLRYSIKFKWSQSLLGPVPIVYQDTVFELISICQETAIWYMKHASVLAANPNVNEDQAKIIYKSLRKASGLFKFVQEKYFDKLSDQPPKGSDLDPKVSNAYQLQCLAEAQEVTIARAIELKHSASLISGLCSETSKLFYTAACSIRDLDEDKVGKFKKYLNLKSTFYESYAYCYNGESLLEQEKAGEAIKSLQENQKNIELLKKLCKEYTKSKGFGISSRLDAHPVFHRLLTISTRIKDKCERENVLIFHQKIPIEGITLYSKATHGLATAEEFVPPNINPLWTNEAYQAFDLNKQKNIKKDKSKNEAKPLPAMKEQIKVNFDPNQKIKLKVNV